MHLNKIEAIKNRQLARLLMHLEKSGQLTPSLSSDMKRAYRFFYEDIIEEIKKGHGMEK